MAIIGNKKSHFKFTVSELAAQSLKVVNFSGTESISELFCYEVELASENYNVDFSGILGKAALLSINSYDNAKLVHGVVCKFDYSGSGRNFALYRARIVPLHYFLSLKKRSKIFQNKNVPDIVSEVLEEAGLGGVNLKIQTSGTYKPREYVVQYRESDLNFITRLLEDEGIFFYFEHEEKRHVLVLGDDSLSHTSLHSPESCIYHQDTDHVASTGEYVFSFHFSQEIRPSIVRLRDFDFKKPGMNLETTDFKEPDIMPDISYDLEVYDYPGKYSSQIQGSDMAMVRLQEVQATAKKGIGTSDCRRLTAGYRLKIDRHDRVEYNSEYLVTRITSSGTQEEQLWATVIPDNDDDNGVVFQNEFECIPSSVLFRPIRKTPKAIIQGSQTAIVVGPSGEEIYTDNYGRVKVQFHWDTEGGSNENSSCWIRVAQEWAGAGWGTVFIPRIGQEVIVNFLEGDPDRPIITGRVYNGEHPVPYELPAEKTKSGIKTNSSIDGKGSNEIRFEDSRGSEEVYIHAEKNSVICTKNNKTQHTGNNEKLDIGKDRVKKVGNDETVTVSNNRTEIVGNDETVTVSSNRTETIGKDETITVGQNSTTSIGKNEDVSIGASASITVGKNRTENIGANSTVCVGKAMTLTVGENRSVSVEKKNTLIVGDSSSIIIGKSGSVVIGVSNEVTVGKKYALEVGDKYTIKAKEIEIEAEDQLQIKVGKAELILKKDGTVQVKGKDIKIKGSGDVKIKGKKVAQN